MGYKDDYARFTDRFRIAVRTRTLRVLTPRNSAWMTRTGVGWWAGYALHEPWEFAYVAPRRMVCRLFGQHNSTCVGRPAPHPRRW